MICYLVLISSPAALAQSEEFTTETPNESALTQALAYASNCHQSATFNPEFTMDNTCTQAIEAALLSDPNLAASYTNRGLIYAARGHYALALEDHTAAIALMPLSAQIYVNRGNSLFLLKRFSEANADYAQAISLSGASIHQALYNRSLVFKTLGYRQKALEELDHAILLAPKNDQYLQARVSISAGQ